MFSKKLSGRDEEPASRWTRWDQRRGKNPELVVCCKGRRCSRLWAQRKFSLENFRKWRGKENINICYPATSRASCSYMRKWSMKRRNMIRINEEVSQRINVKEKLLQFYIIMKDTDNKHNKVTRVTNICWGDADAKNTFFLMSGRRSAAAAAARWLFSFFFVCICYDWGEGGRSPCFRKWKQGKKLIY